MRGQGMTRCVLVRIHLSRATHAEYECGVELRVMRGRIKGGGWGFTMKARPCGRAYREWTSGQRALTYPAGCADRSWRGPGPPRCAAGMRPSG